MALRDFLAVIERVDVARSNRFVVEIQPPNIPAFGMKPQQHINLLCQDATFPGQNIRTSTDDLRQGPTREIGQAVTYGSTTMTFICTPGLPEKLFFEAWQKLMFNSVTWQAKYYKSYIGEIKLRQLDKLNLVRYGVILHEAYPKIINAQDYSNTASDSIQTLQVEFNFHHWTMDESVYTEFQYGSRNEDEDKPKRTTGAGYENMTYEQAQAFLRENSIDDMLSDAVATFPSGQVVPTQIGGGLAGQETTTEEYPSTLMCRPPRKAQVYTTLPNTGRKQAGALIDASQSSVQKLLGLASQLLTVIPTTPPAKPSRVPPAKRGFMKTVQTTPEQQLIELKAAVATASEWVNPNTGKTVRATSGGVKAGGNLLGAMAAGLGMMTRGYKGAVASSGTGVMQQAVGMSTGRSGISIRATISLGGGGGGASGLIARGLSSGIGVGVPRFGGLAAVRGARGLRSTRTVASSGGRANHNAEGGESGDGPGDR